MHRHEWNVTAFATQHATPIQCAAMFCPMRTPLLCAGGGGGIGVRNFSAIFRNFSQFSAMFRQLLFARPPRVLVGAPCVRCAEVLLFEASGGLVTAPQFSAIGFDAPWPQSPPPPCGVRTTQPTTRPSGQRPSAAALAPLPCGLSPGPGSCSVCSGWSSGTATGPASSCGPWGMRPASARTSTAPPTGSEAWTPRGQCSTKEPGRAGPRS